jgi:hypothetical protein
MIRSTVLDSSTVLAACTVALLVACRSQPQHATPEAPASPSIAVAAPSAPAAPAVPATPAAPVEAAAAAAPAKTTTQNLGRITAAPVPGWDVFGGDVSAEEPLAVSALLADPVAYAGRTVVLEGEVQAVCARKGCWMTMVSGGQKLRVTFEDYAFFVPLDAAGRTARIEGVPSVRTWTEAEYKHLLEDQGRTEDAAAHRGEFVELTFEASGVRMRS